MSPLLSFVYSLTVVLVVVALFAVLWRERASPGDTRVALASGAVLAAWAIATTVLAARGSFEPPDSRSAPPIGIELVLVLAVLALCLAVSPTLRRLLTRQANLIRLHGWRLVGVFFLDLMLQGRMPALWALPAGIGDILIGATAPWIARHIDTPRGRRRAIVWNLLGMADLVVAIGLGIMTNPGPAQVFHTTPTSELVTRFPLALVPTFLVPLALTLHVISLWQLLGARWARPFTERRSMSRPTSTGGPGWRPAHTGLS